MVDSIVLNLEVLAVNLLMMMSVGLSLEARHFFALTRMKFSVLGLLVAQCLMLPLSGLIVVSVLSLPPYVKAGVLLLSACPIGDIANFYVLLARANAAISVTLNSLSSALAVITMPAVFIGYSRLFDHQFRYPIPSANLILKLTLLTVVPLGVGMIVRHVTPIIANRLLAPFRLACILGIVLLLLQMFVTERERMTAAWRPTVMAAGFLLLLATTIGIAMARMLGIPQPLKFGGSIIFPVRNIGLAVALSFSLAEGLEYATFAAIFLLVEFPLLLGLVAYHRWMDQRHDEISNDAPFAV